MTHERLVNLLNHLSSNGGDEEQHLGRGSAMVSNQTAIDQLISGLDAFIADLLSKDKEVEKARIKVNADCEKLISN